MSASADGSTSRTPCHRCAGSTSPQPPTPTCFVSPCFRSTAASGRMRRHGALVRSMRGCRRPPSRGSLHSAVHSGTVAPSRAGCWPQSPVILSSPRGCSVQTTIGHHVPPSTTTTGCMSSSPTDSMSHRIWPRRGGGCQRCQPGPGMPSRVGSPRPARMRTSRGCPVSSWRSTSSTTRCDRSCAQERSIARCARAICAGHHGNGSRVLPIIRRQRIAPPCPAARPPATLARR